MNSKVKLVKNLDKEVIRNSFNVGLLPLLDCLCLTTGNPVINSTFLLSSLVPLLSMLLSQNFLAHLLNVLPVLSVLSKLFCLWLLAMSNHLIWAARSTLSSTNTEFPFNYSILVSMSISSLKQHLPHREGFLSQKLTAYDCKVDLWFQVSVSLRCFFLPIFVVSLYSYIGSHLQKWDAL